MLSLDFKSHLSFFLLHRKITRLLILYFTFWEHRYYDYLIPWVILYISISTDMHMKKAIQYEYLNKGAQCYFCEKASGNDCNDHDLCFQTLFCYWEQLASSKINLRLFRATDAFSKARFMFKKNTPQCQSTGYQIHVPITFNFN